MDERIIDEIIKALPDEGLKELNELIDNDADEMKIIDLLEKYNVDMGKIVNGKFNAEQIGELAKQYNIKLPEENS